MSKGGSMGPDGEYIPGTPPQDGTTTSPQEGLTMDWREFRSNDGLGQAARLEGNNHHLSPRDGMPQGMPPQGLPAGMDPRFLTDPTMDIYGNRMPATGGVRGGPGLVSTGMLPRPQPGFGADRLSMAPGFGGGIGGLFNQLAYMPEENFARSMDRYQQFNDQYGSAMGPRNPMNTMNMFSQFGRMSDDQFGMGMNRYQQYRDMFNQPVRPDPRPLPPFSPGSPDDNVAMPNIPKPPRIPVPEPDIFPVSQPPRGNTQAPPKFPPGFDPAYGHEVVNLDPRGRGLPSTLLSQVGGGGFADIPGNYGNPNQAPQYFDQFGPNRNPYARGYGMGYQPSYQPPYMPQQGRLGYNQGPSKGSPGPGMAYMSPAGRDGYGAFGGGQGYYSPSRPSAPAGGSKGGTGGSSPSGKGGSGSGYDGSGINPGGMYG